MTSLTMNHYYIIIIPGVWSIKDWSEAVQIYNHSLSDLLKEHNMPEIWRIIFKFQIKHLNHMHSDLRLEIIFTILKLQQLKCVFLDRTLSIFSILKEEKNKKIF